MERFQKVFLLLTYFSILMEGVAEVKNKLPIMEYLPNGTALTSVVIPSYDDELKPTSLLKAEEAVIIDKDKGILEAYHATVEYFTDREPLVIDMEKARFYYQKSYLEVEEQMTIKNDSFTLKGTGAFYDTKKKELFVTGPAKAFFIPKDTALKFGVGLLSAMALLPSEAAPPSAPSEEILNKVSELRETPDNYSPAQNELVAKKRQEVASQVEDSDKKLSSFLTKTGNADLLVKKERAEESSVLSVPNGALTVTCDDGMYFDAEEGHVVCLKNVVVIEPRFELQCVDQLKIFLNEKKEQTKNEKSMMGFGSSDVKELIATGNVEITYKNEGDQPPIKATGETAYYDVATGEILLEGGLPTVKQGRNFFEALEPKVWVKISKNGFSSGPGKKRTVYLPEEDE